MEDAKKWTVVDIIINSRLYSITASTCARNQYQQMPSAASQTSCKRQAKNLLAQSCPLLTRMMRYSGASHDVITSSAASTVASDAWLCTRLWLRLVAWYCVHVAYFMRRPSASATLVQCHSRGAESHLTHLQSQHWCLTAGAVDRDTTGVSYVRLTCPVADAGCCERRCSLL